MAVLKAPLAVTCLLAILGSGLPGRVAAEEGPSREYALKAAFLYNFLRFVEWPEGELQAPTVCVADAGDAAAAFARALSGRQLDGREVSVRSLSSADAEGCTILFVPEAASGAWPGIRDRLGCRPVLAVGESAQFLGAGGTIVLFADSNRLRFDVNRSSCTGLRFSSRLLSLARTVDGRRAER